MKIYFNPTLKRMMVCFCLMMFATPSLLPAAEEINKKINRLAKSMASDLSDLETSRVAVAKIMSFDKKDSPFSKLITEKLTNSLITASRGSFSVLERTLVDRIMGERINLTAEDAQNLLKADILVTGTYFVLGQEVDLSVRAIDLSTAKVIAASGQTLPLDAVKGLLNPMELNRPDQRDKKELTLSLQVLAIKFIDGKEVKAVVNNGDILYSGDEFKIHFMAGQDCYVYIFYYDSLNQAGVLFPNPKIALANQVRGGVRYSLPGDNLAFRLDDNRGKETLYFVSSLKPMTDIDNLLIEMEKAGGASDPSIAGRLQKVMKVRGIGISSSSAPSTFDDRDRVMDVVKGKGSILKVMEILHR